MTVGSLIKALRNFPEEANVFVGHKIDNSTLAQQVNYDITWYENDEGDLVEDFSLSIISEKR